MSLPTQDGDIVSAMCVWVFLTFRCRFCLRMLWSSVWNIQNMNLPCSRLYDIVRSNHTVSQSTECNFFWFFFLLKFEARTVTARVPPLAWMICALDLGHWASKGNFVCESHPSGWTRLVSTVMRLRCWDKIAQYATTCTWNNLSPDKVIFEWHIWYLVSIPVCKLQLQFGSYVLVCIVWGV